MDGEGVANLRLREREREKMRKTAFEQVSSNAANKKKKKTMSHFVFFNPAESGSGVPSVPACQILKLAGSRFLMKFLYFPYANHQFGCS